MEPIPMDWKERSELISIPRSMIDVDLAKGKPSK
jgi:hypothetical protein